MVGGRRTTEARPLAAATPPTDGAARRPATANVPLTPRTVLASPDLWVSTYTAPRSAPASVCAHARSREAMKPVLAPEDEKVMARRPHGRLRFRFGAPSTMIPGKRPAITKPGAACQEQHDSQPGHIMRRPWTARCAPRIAKMAIESGDTVEVQACCIQPAGQAAGALTGISDDDCSPAAGCPG